MNDDGGIFVLFNFREDDSDTQHSNAKINYAKMASFQTGSAIFTICRAIFLASFSI